MINKNVATLLQHLQCIMLCIYQYRVHIIYKPDPELYIVDWLFQNNHTENRNQEIIGMNVNMHAISTLVDISICSSIEDKQVATQLDEAQIIHNTRQATQKRWSWTEHEILLAN